MSEIDTVREISEQSSEGPGQPGGITGSVSKISFAEQSGEGPGQPGGITGSATIRRTVTAKRKLNTKSIETKYQAILEVEKGQKSKAQIAKQFEVPANTLSTWLKNADKIKEGYMKGGFASDRKKMRTADYPEIEKAVLKWFTTARDQNLPVSGPMLIAQAEVFAQKLGVGNFSVTNGWVDRFKDRHGITFKKVCGESKAVDSESDGMVEWKNRLSSILRDFSSDNIFNADETGIFYRLLPDKTLEFKGVNCYGGKKSKERLTAMVCSNMTGTEKLPLLVIGKSANPRCFKNVRTLPTEYESNKKAWMTSDIFTNWLCKLDKKFLIQKRKVAMVVDNCPAHPNVKNLRAITLVFLPPNTTSKTQPMDQGIIQNIKVHYRKRVILRQIRAIEEKKELTLSVLDALRLLRQAWDFVKAETISNCFRHAGFVLSDGSDDLETEQGPRVDVDDDDDPEDDIPLARLVSMGVGLDEFLNVDDGLQTSATLTDEDIVNEIVAARSVIPQEDSDNDDDGGQDSSRPAVTVEMAMEACDVLRTFLEGQDNTSDLFAGLSKISDCVVKKDFSRRCAKQSLITNFFRN